jgi:hypothetical protein
MNTNYQNQLKQTKEVIDSMPWDNPLFYQLFLAQTYYFVSHSTRLLARSISHFGVDRDNLYRRFVAHLKEENYHERLVVNDLKSSAQHPTDFQELSITRAFWETQFYKIDQTKGISLLGYILYLEAIPVHCFKGVEGMFPKKSSSFAQVHMDEDPAHLQSAISMINEMNPDEQSEIWSNFHQTSELYQIMLCEINNLIKYSAKVA